MSIGKWLLTLLLSAAVTVGTWAAFMHVLRMEPGRAGAAAAATAVDPLTNAQPTAIQPVTEQTAEQPIENVAGMTVTEAPAPATLPATVAAAATAPAAPAPTGTEKIVISTVYKPGQRTSEYVLLANEAGGRVDMTGWTLEGSNGKIYTFPNFVLFADTYVRVYTMSGNDTPTNRFWNQSEAIWKVGDVVLLKKGDVEIARFTVK